MADVYKRQMKVRAHQHDTVDALCWRHYGRTQGVTEQVLKANPGLAEYGPFLPVSYTHLDVYKRQSEARPFCR